MGQTTTSAPAMSSLCLLCVEKLQLLDFPQVPKCKFNQRIEKMQKENNQARQNYNSFSSVQSHSRVQPLETLWTAACQASPSITNSQSLLKLMSIELVMPCNHLILCHTLLFLPSIFPSIRVFSNESILRIRWPKYWSLSFSLSPSNECSGLISFRIHWFDLLVVQGTLMNLLQQFSH